MPKKTLSILLAHIPAGFVVASVLLVILFRFAPIGFTPLMVKRALLSNQRVDYQWVRLEDVSPETVAAVIAAEDSRFLRHNGFDFEELSKMHQQHLFDGSPIRGCSTISQQTAKNCFTWCTNTWLRKAIEAYFTVLIEFLWGKDRILEVYLNVAEMGPGIYGVEAAAQHYFHVAASELTLADASSLACCLPNPLHRTPDWVNRNMATRRAQIASSASKLIK